MATVFIQCPHCRHTSKDKLWDMQTKERLGLGEDNENYTPAREGKGNEYDPFFYCPVCEREVEGNELIMDSDIVPR